MAAGTVRGARGLAAWLRYEAIYLWPSWRGYSAFNCGFAPVDAEVAGRFPKEALQIQLYAELLKQGGGAKVLSGGLLEVAAGRGGGLAYLDDEAPGAELVGVDRSWMAVRHGRARGLDLRRAAAESLPFADGSVACVACLDSANTFGDPAAAFAEMGRVLAPAGTVLHGDFILGPIEAASARLEGWAQGAGLKVASFRDVTANVVEAIRLDSPRKAAALAQVPHLLRPWVRETLTLEGTERYRQWIEGERSYYLAALRRSGARRERPASSPRRSGCGGADGRAGGGAARTLSSPAPDRAAGCG